MKIAFLSTHPIHYHSPLFRELAAAEDLLVFYAARASVQEQADAGFGVAFEWDIPLFEGYSYRFLQNVARKPGIHTFRGLDTPEINQILADHAFDAIVIHGWHYKAAWQAIFAAWKLNLPVLVRSDSHLNTPRTALLSAVKWPWYRFFVPRLDACLPVGVWSEEYFLHYGAQPSRIFRVPHCIDTHRFQSHSRALCREQLREQWDLPRSSVTFLFAGKLIPKKRPLDFLSALAHCRESGLQISGLIAGDGPLRAECEKFIRQNHLIVRFTGFLNQSQIVKAYAASDALVLPSEGSETWGLVVNEAMACGLPAFISDMVGCGPDLIETGRTGGIFPLGDTAALAALMVRFGHNACLAEMGRLAQERSESHSVRISATALANAVSSVVRRQRERHS